MIINYIDPQKLPDIIVWMDWQLYAHSNIFIINFILLTIIWLFAKKVALPSYPLHIIFGICAYFVAMFVIYGPGVG